VRFGEVCETNLPKVKAGTPAAASKPLLCAVCKEPTILQFFFGGGLLPFSLSSSPRFSSDLAAAFSVFLS
jgi:hypothetical protein